MILRPKQVRNQLSDLLTRSEMGLDVDIESAKLVSRDSMGHSDLRGRTGLQSTEWSNKKDCSCDPGSVGPKEIAKSCRK